MLHLAGTVAIDDAALREVVRGHFEIDAIAGKYADAVPAEAARDVCQDRHAVLELDGERRAGKNLFYRPKDLDRGLFGRLGALGLGARLGVVPAPIRAACYDRLD